MNKLSHNILTYHCLHGYHTLGNQTCHPSFHRLQSPNHQRNEAATVSNLVNNCEVYYQGLVSCV